MIFYVTYYRHDKKNTETKVVKAKTMLEAIERLVRTAKGHNVEISKISCKINGCEHTQEFCDKCKINYKLYSFTGKYNLKINLCVNCKENWNGTR